MPPGQKPMSKQASPTESGLREFKLLEDTDLLSAAVPGAPAVTPLQTGAMLALLETTQSGGKQWVRVRNSDGLEGFISGETKVEEQTKCRFRVERLVFVCCAALITGVIAGPHVEIGIGGMTLAVGFGLGIFYFGVKQIAGVGGYFEQIPSRAEVPSFDWVRFLLEPLMLVGCVLAAAIVTGIGAVVQWAFSNHK